MRPTPPPPIAMLFWPALLLLSILAAGCDSRTEPVPAGQSAGVIAAPQQITLSPLTNMVLIKAGTFTRLKYQVTVSQDFWLGRYEVTQGEYAAVIGKNPSYFQGPTNCPVEKVSEVDAAAYCAALSKRERDAGHLPPGYEYRLPSEAEWEYACRAGTTNRFSFGDDPAQAPEYAWTSENSDAKTHPVGQKRPNPWGLYDMHGNVWEWCADWFAPFPATNLTDPVGPPASKYKVFRGGGWNNDVEFARSGNRFMMSASNAIHFVGFRVALGRPLPRP
jgi:formylglycine-generating enzyme required for sulfatase activity